MDCSIASHIPRYDTVTVEMGGRSSILSSFLAFALLDLVGTISSLPKDNRKRPPFLMRQVHYMVRSQMILKALVADRSNVQSHTVLPPADRSDTTKCAMYVQITAYAGAEVGTSNGLSALQELNTGIRAGPHRR